ncbi:MAG: methyl-accepting chemotaxis protein [Solirubrobacterales bacterium]
MRLRQDYLGRVSIRLRIASLVALALAGAAIFATIYATANDRLDHALEAQDGYRRLNDMAADAQARALALRVQTEQFLRERDPRYAAAFHEDAERLVSTLAAMRDIAQVGAIRSQVADLAASFQQLEAEFARVEVEVHRLGLSEQDGLRGSLNASVGAIEGELRMWPNAAPLLIDMLQMRQAEKTFMITGDEAALGHHARHAKQFDFALDATTLSPSTRQDFRRLLAAYSADMKAFGAGTVALAGEVAAIRRHHAELAPRVDEVFAFAHAGTAQAIDDQKVVRSETSWETSVFGLLGLAAFTAVATAIAISIVRPLRRIESAMQALAGGDTAVAVPCGERTDEIGAMARAVHVFKENAERVARMHIEHESVRREAEAASRGQVLTLAQRFEDAVKDIADTVTTKAVEIQQTAGGIAGDGDGSGNGWSLTVAEAAEQARHTVVAVTQATRDLGASVGRIAEHGAAVTVAVGAAVTELTTAEERVRALAEMAGRIDRIVALIGDIAQRTNMLSLNATIEAQRAGEAGKGFAVVAGEVKRLALLTARSAREIAAEIAAIQGATGDTVHAMGGVGRSIREMDALAHFVQAAVEHQTEVSALIERCVTDVREKTHVLSEGVASFTHSAARQCGAAAKLLWAAEDLAAPTSTLKDEVGSFLATVRAA